MLRQYFNTPKDIHSFINSLDRKIFNLYLVLVISLTWMAKWRWINNIKIRFMNAFIKEPQ